MTNTMTNTLARRIIPCLDVAEGRVVKGIRFRDHIDAGDVFDLAARYRDEGADELVLYEIRASAEGRVVDYTWVQQVAEVLDIPFCVAGGIRTVEHASRILHAGAEKVSINSPALERPELIDELVREFGTQCIVIGIDSWQQGDRFEVHQYTGSETTTRSAARDTFEWALEVQDRGAGEIVLNCMNEDGRRKGYDLTQLTRLRNLVNIPIIASGGAGTREHFRDAFREAEVDGTLAATVFHTGAIPIPDLKSYLRDEGVQVRQ